MSIIASFGQGDVWSIADLDNFSSHLSDILDKGNFTLDEILVEDALLQEIKSRNMKLINFLAREDILKTLIEYVTVPGPEGESDNRCYKFPYMSCEIICCEVPEVLEVLVSKQELLDALFSVVSKETIENNYLAGYFEKVLEVLFKTKTLPMMTFVNNAERQLFHKFLKHISNYSVMQIVQRLLLPHIPYYTDVTGDKMTDEEKERCHCRWSYEFYTVESLIRTMLDASDDDTIIHIADLLITVIQLSPAEAPILKYLCEGHVINEVWTAIGTDSKRDGSHMLQVSAVSILECILSRLYEMAASVVYESNDSLLLSNIKASFQNILIGVAPALPKIRQHFEFYQLSSRNVLSLNQRKENFRVLGQLNFYYVKLIEGLIRLGDDHVDELLVESGILHLIVDMLFSFKYHSMMHLSLQRMVLVILDDFIHRKNICFVMFMECNMLRRLQEELAFAVSVPIGSRYPIVGHLIIIAQAVNMALLPVKREHSDPFAENVNAKEESLATCLGEKFDYQSWSEFSSSSLLILSSVVPQSITFEEVNLSALHDNSAKGGVEQELDEVVDWNENSTASPKQMFPFGENFSMAGHIDSGEWTANFDSPSVELKTMSVPDEQTNFAIFDKIWSANSVNPLDASEVTISNNADFDPFADSSIDSLIS